MIATDAFPGSYNQNRQNGRKRKILSNTWRCNAKPLEMKTMIRPMATNHRHGGGASSLLLLTVSRHTDSPALCGSLSPPRVPSLPPAPLLLARATGRGSLLFRVLFEVTSFAGAWEQFDLQRKGMNVECDLKWPCGMATRPLFGAETRSKAFDGASRVSSCRRNNSSKSHSYALRTNGMAQDVHSGQRNVTEICEAEASTT